MTIIGLTGPICAGKKAFADYLVKKHGFLHINLLQYFKKMLKHQAEHDDKLSSPLIAKYCLLEKKKLERSIDEETKESQSDSSQVGLRDPMITENDNEEEFCFEYYMCKRFLLNYSEEEFHELRSNLIRVVFKHATALWDQNIVIYPLSSLD